MLLVILVLIVGAVAAVLLLRGTILLVMYLVARLRNSRGDILLSPSQCSRCDRPIGRFEGVRTFHELLLGGWTCPGCGSEFDQLGDVRVARSINAHLRDRRDRADREALRDSMADDRTPVEKLFED